MKKIFFIILLAAAVTACKKNGSGSGKGKMLISKVFSEDLLINEFIYDLDGKIARADIYVKSGGVSNLTSYHLYHYKDGQVSEKILYSKDHIPLARQVLSYSDQGKLVRVDEAVIADGNDDLNVMDLYWTYGYNEKGQLETMYNHKSNSAYLNHRKFIYDNQGLWQGWEYYHYEDFDYKLKEKIEFSPGGKSIPDHWKHFLIVPSDFNLFRLFVPGYKVTSYWVSATGSVLNYSFENREYKQGYVTKETMKEKSASNTNESERRFEYIQ